MVMESTCILWLVHVNASDGRLTQSIDLPTFAFTLQVLSPGDEKNIQDLRKRSRGAPGFVKRGEKRSIIRIPLLQVHDTICSHQTHFKCERSSLSSPVFSALRSSLEYLRTTPEGRSCLHILLQAIYVVLENKLQGQRGESRREQES